MKTALILLAVMLATVAMFAPWVGVYHDHRDGQDRLFIKHRPSLHWYFRTDAESLRESRDLPPELRRDDRMFDEFIVVHQGFQRSVALPGG